MRVLFVDDDPFVLEGLERSLHHLRSQWFMTFVTSGAEAVERLAHGGYDVLVTDMKMPQMSGVELVLRVRAQYPTLVCVVLSGYAEFEMALRAIPVAHHYLLKPCDPDEVEDAVERGYALRCFLAGDAIQAAVTKAGDLPVAPRVYSRLVATLSRPDSGLAEIAAVIEDDSVLASKVVALANSAYLGAQGRIDSVRQATIRLGTNMLKNLVVGVEAFRDLQGSPRTAAVHESIRRHSIHVGQLAARLVRKRYLGEQAYLAGLLHDIGKLVLMRNSSEDFARVIELVESEGQTVHRTGQQVMGTMHAEVGAALLNNWGLSYPVIEAVAYHHHPEVVGAKRSDVLHAVYIADQLVHEQRGEPLTKATLSFLRSQGVLERLEEWRRDAAVACATSPW